MNLFDLFFRSRIIILFSWGWNFYFIVLLAEREELKQIAQTAYLALIHETYSGLNHFAFEDASIADMAEQPQIHRSATVEHVLERHVVYKILREILVCVGIGSIVSSDDDFHPVVEHGLVALSDWRTMC